MNEQLTRDFKIESIRADEEAGGYWATLATEFPVSRDFGDEVLLCEPGAIDLSRAPLPLIISHDTRDLNVGVVEKIEPANRKLKGLLRLGNSSRAKEIDADIRANVITNLSIGYRILNYREEGDQVIATKWAPHEVSLVSVGADPHAGIGRNFKQDTDMSDDNDDEKAGTLTRSQKAQQKLGAEEERERVLRITEIGKKYDLEAEATRFIEEGLLVEDFNKRVLDEIGKRNVETYETNTGPAIHTTGQREFSISNLVRQANDESSRIDIGYELEVSEEIGRNYKAQRGMILVPMGELTRAVTIGGAGTGANTLQETVLSGSFIDALVAESTVMALNPTMLTGLTDDIAIPKATANPSVGWYDLDDVDTITNTDPTLTQVNLTPKSCAANVVLSHKMILQSSVDAESMIRQMLARQIAVEIDNKLLQGDGTGGTPTGVINFTGVQNHEYTNGGDPTWANIVNSESLLLSQNVSANNVAYVVDPTMAGTLKTTDVGTDTGQFVLQNGMMNGYRARGTSNCPAGTVILGAWSNLVFAQWGGLMLDIEKAPGWNKGSTHVRAIIDVDVAARHDEAFVTLTEAP